MVVVNDGVDMDMDMDMGTDIGNSNGDGIDEPEGEVAFEYSDPILSGSEVGI
jgi:hypothetical protein